MLNREDTLVAVSILSSPLDFMPFAVGIAMCANELNQNLTLEQSDDPDEYDDFNEANDPGSPIWDGATVHSSVFGSEPTLSSQFDPNEITQD